MEGLKVALETTKQVITLSTGVIALTITFLEKVVQPNGATARTFPGSLKAAWIFYGLSIVFGIWTMMAITGTMNALDREARKLALTGEQPTAVSKLAEGSNIRIPSGLMLATFALAMLLTIATGFSL